MAGRRIHCPADVCAPFVAEKHYRPSSSTRLQKDIHLPRGSGEGFGAGTVPMAYAMASDPAARREESAIVPTFDARSVALYLATQFARASRRSMLRP